MRLSIFTRKVRASQAQVDEAAKTKREAAGALKTTQANWPAVREVTRKLEAHRLENQFSQLVVEALKGHV